MNTQFTIYRDNWLRGEADARLLRISDNKMCCFGQIACQAGTPLEKLANVGSLDKLKTKDRQALVSSNPALSVLFDGNGEDSDLSQEIMRTNDREDLNDEILREEHIAGLFLTIGIAVSFVDGPAPWFLDAGIETFLS